MNTTSSLLSSLFKASLSALGAYFSPVSDPRCPARTAISGANEVATITTVRDGWDSKEAVLYVHPDLGFKGVLIVVAGDGWTFPISFTMDNTCFPQHDGVWWRLKAGVLRKSNKNNGLDIYGAIGDCKLECSVKGPVPGDSSLNVEALGPSRLRFADPYPCTTIKNPSGDYKMVKCTTPLDPKTPTTTTTPTTTITTTNNNNNNNITTTTTTTTTLSPASDQRCPADTTISLAKEWVNTTTVQTWGHVHQKVLYVHPDPNFKGVKLVATGDGWRSAAWFTSDNTCFPQDADWWQLWINVEREWRNNNPLLSFGLNAGECSLNCYHVGHFTGDMNVHLEAKGPSRWRFEDPEPCSVVNNVKQRFSTITCAEPQVPKIITVTSTTSQTTTSPKMTGAGTAVVVLVVIIVLVGGVSVVVVVKRRIRKGRLRVKSWNWSAACWGVGGQAVDGDKHKETPMVPTVLQPRPPRPESAASWAVRREAADYNNRLKPVRVPMVHPRVPPRPGHAASWAVRGKAADDNNHAAPPRVEIAAPAYYHHQSKNADDDDDDYLTPRRAPPGTPSGVTEGEEPIYEEIPKPAFSRQSKNVDDDDDDYLTPRRAPQGTTSWVTKEEEPIYDELYVPAHYRQ